MAMPKDHSNSDTYTRASHSNRMSRASMLRDVVCGSETGFLMEAHNALSAKIAQNVGFRALWASSLTISATMGLRDANELTWSESLDIVSAMVDATNVPVLMDADSGYGDFNIVSRFVRKACDRGVAGVCMEDKLFPKINSFAETKQKLTSINDFCSKISAAKDSQTEKDFTVVARTEAFVIGAELEETLERANAYHEAGADAILVHSKLQTADEILAFASKWNNQAPLVIVPTTYASTPTSQFIDAGISAIIWANHSLRASIRAIENLTSHIYQQQSLAGVDEAVASIDEIFALTNMNDLITATKRHQGGE